VIVHNLAQKTLDPGAGLETFASTATKPAESWLVPPSCWAFRSRASVIHVQGAIS